MDEKNENLSTGDNNSEINNEPVEQLESSNQENMSGKELGGDLAPQLENDKSNNEIPTGNKKSPIVPIIIGVVSVGIIGLLAYFITNTLFMSDRQIVQHEVKEVFKGFHATLNNVNKQMFDYDLEKDALGLEGDFTFKSNYKDSDIDLSKLDKYKITYKGVIDKSNNKASGNIGLNGDGKSLLNLKGYINGKKAVFDLGDVYDKTLGYELDEELKDLEFTNSLNVEDLELIVNKTEEFTKNYIKDEDITSEKVNKEINGKKANYKKVSYKLDLNNYAKELLTAYKEDDEVLTVLSNLANEEKSQLKKQIEEAITELGKEEKSELTINVYLSGKIAKEIEILNEEGSIVIYNDLGIYNYQFMEKDKELFHGQYDKNEKKFTFEMKDEDSNTNVNYSMNFSNNNKVDGTLRIENEGYLIKAIFAYSNVVKKDSQKTNLKLDLNIKVGDENITAYINNNNTLSKNMKIDEVSEKNTVNIESISEDDMLTIESKLGEKLQPIINDVMPGMNSSSMF